MGNFHVAMEVGDTQGLRYEPMQALVDSGATYNILPAPLLRRLGVRPTESGSFILAAGRRIQRHMGQTWVRLDGREYIAPVVFGGADTQPILGAVTLEIFRLGIDPVAERLIPVEGYMLPIDPDGQVD